MLKKLLISILLSSFVLASFASFLPSKVRAQAPPGQWYDQGAEEWYLKVYDEQTSPPNEIFGERYTAAQVNWIIWSILLWLPTKILGPERMVCILPAISPGQIDVGACLSAALAYDNQSVDKYLASYSDKSIVASIFADRPLSGITYVKNLARKFKLIPEVKAQGFGFTTALDPILPLWQGSRDIAYSLFVFVAIIFAFMIMFRVKISPQTVITVQSALPKLAVAIILVTFSYAIAGFLVDLMYVVIGLVALLANSFIPGVQTATMFYNLTNGPLGFGAPGLILVYLIAFALASALVVLLSIGAVGAGIAGIFAAAGIGAISVTGVGLIVGIIIIILLALLVIWHSLKILWMLLKAFVSILLLTIFAPFQIAIGTLIPNFGFSAWVKSMASSLAVFVVAGVLFVFSFIFLGQAVTLALRSVGFQILGGNVNVDVGQLLIGALFGGGVSSIVTGNYATGWPPLLSGGTTDASIGLLFLGASLVTFISIPKAGDIIKSLIEGRPFAYGTAIGEAFGPVGAAWGRTGAPITGAYQRLSSEAMVQNLASRLAANRRFDRLPKFIQTTVRGMGGQRSTDQGGRS